MFRMMNGMGPRGPMAGHRGFARRMRRNPAGGLLVLPAVLIGLPVFISLLGVAMALLSGLGIAAAGVVYGLGRMVARLFSGTVSVVSIAMGVGIGLILYANAKNRKAEREAAAEKQAREEQAQEAAPAETESVRYTCGGHC